MAPVPCTRAIFCLSVEQFYVVLLCFRFGVSGSDPGAKFCRRRIAQATSSHSACFTHPFHDTVTAIRTSSIVSKCRIVDSSFRRSFDPATRLCCQGSPFLTCHVLLECFPPRTWCVRQPVHSGGGGARLPTPVTVLQLVHNVALNLQLTLPKRPSLHRH